MVELCQMRCFVKPLGQYTVYPGLDPLRWYRARDHHVGRGVLFWDMLVTATTQTSIRLCVKESLEIFLNKLSMLVFLMQPCLHGILALNGTPAVEIV